MNPKSSSNTGSAAEVRGGGQSEELWGEGTGHRQRLEGRKRRKEGGGKEGGGREEGASDLVERELRGETPTPPGLRMTHTS